MFIITNKILATKITLLVLVLTVEGRVGGVPDGVPAGRGQEDAGPVFLCLSE